MDTQIINGTIVAVVSIYATAAALYGVWSAIDAVRNDRLPAVELVLVVSSIALIMVVYGWGH